MPIVTFTQVNHLTVAPTALDPPATFPQIAHDFFSWLAIAVYQINILVSAYVPSLTAMTTPSDGDATFAAEADTQLAAMPLLVTEANAMIDELSMACAHITALPTPPSRGADPGGFVTTAPTFLAALPTFRTEFNAFIDGINSLLLAGFPGFGRLLLSGDMQSGTDHLLLSGDAQVSGADVLVLSGSF